jgi:hypothetical protein
LPSGRDVVTVTADHGQWFAEDAGFRLAAHEAESPLMPLDETISIMETMDIVLAQARRDA